MCKQLPMNTHWYKTKLLGGSHIYSCCLWESEILPAATLLMFCVVKLLGNNDSPYTLKWILLGSLQANLHRCKGGIIAYSLPCVWENQDLQDQDRTAWGWVVLANLSGEACKASFSAAPGFIHCICICISSKSELKFKISQTSAIQSTAYTTSLKYAWNEFQVIHY